MAAVLLFISITFNATPLSGCVPLVVSFQDVSTGSPTQWKWDLGNSTISFLQNPVATYFNPGLYTIKLIVQNASGADSITKTQYITVYALPSVNFSANALSGCYPLPVQFTHASTAGSGSITSYLWDFGDGNTSTSPNPLHIYTASGTYNVSLQIINSNGCSKTLTRTNYINISNGVQAVFTNSTPLSCSPPETISFQNQSTGTGTLSYQWNFGDGATSTLTNPSHTYTATGSYTVQLIVVNSAGCRDTAIHTAGVNIGAVLANFTVPSSVCAGTAITFVNTSLPAPDSVLWDFGDATGSAVMSPVKTFAAGGNYPVKLLSYFGACKDSVTKNVMVFSKPSSAFSGSPLIACIAPLTVNFNNTTIGATTYQWDFGDGATSATASPSHTYTAAGFYTVTLISTNANGCTDTLVKPAFVKIQLPQASINNLPQQGCAPFTWTFGATINSVDAVTAYLWDFGDGTTSSLMNPTHIFPAGVYTIQLIVTTAGGCKDTVIVPAGLRSSVKPVANFSANPRDVCAFVPVTFTDLSTGIVNEWYWLFGDGGQSTDQNPTHAYEDTGLFTVRLVVGNSGCYDTLTFINYIHVNPPIANFAVTINCDQPFVRIFTDNSIGADEWNWDFGDGSTSTLPSPSHTYATAGNFNVILRVKNNTSGCEHSKTIPVVVADEQANFSATALEICKRSSTTFNAVSNNSAGIVNFEWDFGDGTTGTGNPLSHVYIQSGDFNVRLIITDAAGCTDTSTKLNYIRVNGPTADFNPAVPGSCLQSSITFNDLSVTDGIHAITEWSWNYGDGNSEMLTSPPFMHSYANQGTYAVSLLVKDAAGCTDSIFKDNLIVISIPVADFSAADTISCPSNAIVFSNNSTGPGLSYLWNFGDGITSNQMSPAHSYTSDGIYTVQLTITDSYGCTAAITKDQYITIVSPVADFSVSDSVSTCPPLIVQFTNTSSNQSTYNWDFGDGTFSSAISPSHFYNVAGIYFAKLSITGPGGCTSVKTKKIEVRGPKGSFTYQNFTGCKPLTVNFTATSQDRISFIWDFNDGTTIATNDSVIAHTYTIPGIYLPKMILKDAAGCTVPITGLDTIIVSGVNAAFTADTLLHCSNGSVQFTNATVSNDLIVSFLWDFGDGTTSTQTSPVHFYAGEGIFTPKLKAITAMGCRDSVAALIPVKIVKTPSIAVTQSSNGCVPLIMNFSGNLLNADTAAINWQWTFNDGRNTSGKIIDSILFANAGNYTATLLATNSSGCKDTTQTFIEAYALPFVNAGRDVVICQGTGQTISASGAFSYSWSPATALSCTNCASPVATPALVTQYIVTGTSVNGCRNSDTVKVNVAYPFKMKHSTGDTLCIGESAILSASGAASYTWSPSLGLSSSTTATVTAKPAATTTYMLIGKDDKACFKDTAYFPVKVYPIPAVNAGPDLTINVGQMITITPEISADVIDVIWSPTGGIFRSSFPSVNVKPSQTTHYKVEVSNAGSCTASDLVSIFVLCNGSNVFIPNTFSPNGDGVNEVFYPRGTGLFRIKSARIFNRWGEVVFQNNNMLANDASGGWDGTYKGQKLASDVYVYMIEIICDNNSVLLYKGDIALIR
jgi:gliding motility-associated-like protein